MSEGRTRSRFAEVKNPIHGASVILDTASAGVQYPASSEYSARRIVLAASTASKSISTRSPVLRGALAVTTGGVLSTSTGALINSASFAVLDVLSGASDAVTRNMFDALVEAACTTDSFSTRFALGCVQVRGKGGTLAILGGQPVRTKPWPSWPVWDPAAENDLVRVAQHDDVTDGQAQIVAHLVHDLPAQLVAAAGLLLLLEKPLVDGIEVCKHQFGFYHLDVSLRADLAVDMYYVRVGETAHDMNYGVHLADVAQELVAKALALACALDEPRDVHDLHGGGRQLLGVVHLVQHHQALVRHLHDADVRVDRCKGVVGRLRARR